MQWQLLQEPPRHRDALGALLQEVKDEESLLRDYVMGIGCR